MPRMSSFSTMEGIKREMTVPYNPEQNGVAERKNRSIIGATLVKRSVNRWGGK
jgi:hypothetical protein